MRNKILFFILSILLVSCGNGAKQSSTVTLQNPILPGYFADPSIVEHEGKFYMYVTADPWGTEFLSWWHHF